MTRHRRCKKGPGTLRTFDGGQIDRSVRKTACCDCNVAGLTLKGAGPDARLALHATSDANAKERFRLLWSLCRNRVSVSGKSPVNTQYHRACLRCMRSNSGNATVNIAALKIGVRFWPACRGSCNRTRRRADGVTARSGRRPNAFRSTSTG